MDSIQIVSVNRNRCFCVNGDMYTGHLTDIYNIEANGGVCLPCISDCGLQALLHYGFHLVRITLYLYDCKSPKELEPDIYYQWCSLMTVCSVVISKGMDDYLNY